MVNRHKNKQKNAPKLAVSGGKKIKGLIHGSHLIKHIGDQWLFIQPAMVRHLLLMFDELVVVDLPTSNSVEILASLEFLQSHKLVKMVDSVEYMGKILTRLKSNGNPTAKLKLFLDDFLRVHNMILNAKGNSLKFVGKVLSQETEIIDRNISSPDIFRNTYDDMENIGLLENSLMARNFSRFYSEFTESSVTPIVPSLNSVRPELIPDNRISEVLQIIIPELPVPSESTPLEKLVEFRLDEASIRKYRRLKHWIAKISRQEIPPKEIEEEFQELLFEYRESLRIHNIEFGTTIFEAIVTVSPSVLAGNLFKLIGLPFCFKRKEEALLKLEQSGVGHEVAYILHAKDSFS